MNGRIRLGRRQNAPARDDIPKMRRIPRRRTACNMRDIPPACVLDCVRDLVVHSPVTSLFPAVPFLPSFPLALALPAFLPHSSTWFYHAITWTIDHTWRSARSRKRETEMNRGRGKRSPRAYGEANAVCAPPSVSIVSLIHRVIILANNVRSVFFFF